MPWRPLRARPSPSAKPRRPLCLATVALIALGGCRTSAAPSPEALVQRVLSALKSGQPGGLESILPTEGDFRDLFKHIRKRSRRKLGLAIAARLPAKVRRKVLRGFGTVLRIARERGIRWAKVVVERIDRRAQPGKFPSGAETGDLFVSLEEGGKRFRLWLDDCFRSTRGWVIGEHLYWRRAAKKGGGP